MDTKRADILKLIYAAIKGQKLELSEEFSLKSVIPLAVKHNIVTLCYYGAIECGLDGDLPEMHAIFNGVCKYICVSEQQEYVARRLYALFDEKGFSYMPLKGVLLKNLYPHPEMRVMGDLDILIKLDEYPKIKSCLEELGYYEIRESDPEFVWECQGVHVELHKRLVSPRNKDFYDYFGDGWRLATLCDGTRYSMSDEAQFIYLFTHFSKHYRDGGIGIKQMVDLWVYRSCKTNLNEDYVVGELEKLCLRDFYKNVCRTLKVWFEGEESDEITDLITETIFESGVFGGQEAHTLSEGVKISATTGRRNVRVAKFFGKLFLPYSAMCTKYRILKSCPILLPLMWAVRIFEALFCKRKSVGDNINDIKLMSEKNIDAHKKRLEKVGLSFNFKI